MESDVVDGFGGNLKIFLKPFHLHGSVLSVPSVVVSNLIDDDPKKSPQEVMRAGKGRSQRLAGAEVVVVKTEHHFVGFDHADLVSDFFHVVAVILKPVLFDP